MAELPDWMLELVEEIETAIIVSPLGPTYVKLPPSEIAKLRREITQAITENRRG